MNTYKSKIFTIKSMAEIVSKRRDQNMYLLGTNNKGNNVYYVGKYTEANKLKWKYKNN